MNTMHMGTDTLLFALLVMLFGGVGQLSNASLFPGDSGIYVMALGLFIGLMGFWQAGREAVGE